MEKNINQLFILDDFGYKQRGSYYLGENGDFFLVEEVCTLISGIKHRYKLSSILTAGSSKGGDGIVLWHKNVC